MYGSIHNHFESEFDTANGDFTTMLRSYAAAGSKKVVVTDHGRTTAYFDAVDALKALQKDGECKDLELIFGVEGYFGTTENEPKETKHIILFAKDYEGYCSICKIVSQSNKDYVWNKNGKSGRPVITLENLKENVAKGHVVCTSACIAGIFGADFGLTDKNIKNDIKTALEKIESLPVEDNLLLTKEDLSGSIFKKLGNINIYDKTDRAPKLIRNLVKEGPYEDEAREFVRKYELSIANNLILAELKKEKKPKAPKGMQVSETALGYFNARKAFYENFSEREEFKGKKREFNTLCNLLEEAENLPSEEAVLKKHKTLYNKLINIFGKNDFYFELQNHGIPEEEIIYNKVVDFAKSLDNTDHFIVSNDVHVGIGKAYVDRNWDRVLNGEVAKRDVVRFARFNRFFDDDSKIPADDYEYYIKDDDELKASLLKILPEDTVENGFSNLNAVLEKCHIEFPEKENHYPSYTRDGFEDKTPEEILNMDVAEGIKERFPEGLSDKYKERLDYELGIIKGMGYASYHLIVADYLNYGRLLGYLPKDVIASDACPLTIEGVKKYIEDHNIPKRAYSIGPGRGSAVGSLVCYLLGITDIDPIKYNLLFERFLNPERASMPDIDSDFRPDIREKCIEYAGNKYGKDNVCGISTKTYLAEKGAIRLAGRYLGEKNFLNSNERKELLAAGTATKAAQDALRKWFMKPYYNAADKLTKEADKITAEDKDASILTDYTPETNLEKNILAYTRALTGLFTTYGKHAAGVIISKDNINEKIATMLSEKKNVPMSEIGMAKAESMGFLKMDFLGLDNLGILSRMIAKTGDTFICEYKNRDALLSDPRIFKEIYESGFTQGVFQFESRGMKTYLQRFKPESFEDVILLNAAYRPGPMQFLPEVIAEKWYRKYENAQTEEERKEACTYLELDENGVPLPVKHSINIDNDDIKRILAPTYGSIIYQEQIMQICTDVAGFTMGHADTIRKHMSKKHVDDLAAERPLFVEGCVTHGHITEEEADSLFDKMMDFGKYAFNKSHATAYSLVSIFTAYFKVYHPAVFYAESFNACKELSEMEDFCNELPQFGITLSPPDIKRSENEFTAAGNTVYFGLSGIKGLTDVDIVPADDFSGFLMTNYSQIDPAEMEKLIYTGMFDGMTGGISRKALAESVKDLYKKCTDYEKNEAKLDALNEKKAFLNALAGKGRLTAEEKLAFKDMWRLRKDIDKISIADVSSKQEAVENDLKKLSFEVSDFKTSLDRYLSRLALTGKEDVLFNRKKEKETLGYVFDIKESKDILEKCATFPEGTVDMRTVVEEDIPNLGLIVLNPKVKVTPGGWTKVLCCDKNRVCKNIYFKDGFPEDVTEFILNFKAEKLQEIREDGDNVNSNNIYVAPYAYSRADIGKTDIFVYSHPDEKVLKALLVDIKAVLNEPFYPDAYLFLPKQKVSVPIRESALTRACHHLDIDKNSLTSFEVERKRLERKGREDVTYERQAEYGGR